MKKGRDGSYAGGAVWQTREEADASIKAKFKAKSGDYSVFGVDADWDEDTEEPGQAQHDAAAVLGLPPVRHRMLKRDALLVRLDSDARNN